MWYLFIGIDVGLQNLEIWMSEGTKFRAISLSLAPTSFPFVALSITSNTLERFARLARALRAHQQPYFWARKPYFFSRASARDH
jgi:hypothetical protein